MKKSIIIEENNCYNRIKKTLENLSVGRILLVCKSPERNANYTAGLKEDFEVETFDKFSPNPSSDEIECGISAAMQFGPDALFAIGGGSSIDSAKGIKYGLLSEDNEKYKNTPIIIALPTTAGSGSEATRFAVVYKGNEKLSLENESILPDVVILDSSTLKSLPLYQKKATLLDALCHSIESYWSINSTKESKEYAITAISLILGFYRDYFKNNESAFPKIMKASNLAGKAINISKTTAAHAMCYKITKLKGIPHGISAFMCLPYVCEHMAKSGIDKAEYTELLNSFGVDGFEELSASLKSLMHELELDSVISINQAELNEMVSGVNLQRLGNFPASFSKDDIESIYRKIFKVEEY